MGKTNPSVPRVHHYLRSFFAGLLGAIALLLVSLSIFVIWANRTLTDTPTFVSTVRPLISQPALDNYIADQVTSQLLTQASVPQLAQSLLTPAQNQGSPAQVQALVTPVIRSNVVKILSSPGLAEAWEQTNQSVHASLISQLRANQPVISLDLSPLVSAVLSELKQTQLAPIAAQINLQPSSAVVTLKGTELEKIHQAYNILIAAPYVIVFLALLFAGLSILVSVHHNKTLRRMLIDVGLSSFLLALLIQLPVFIKLPSSSPAAQQVALAVVHVLLHGLEVSLIILGTVCILTAIGSKVYERRRHAVA
jgi:hypothetical protein